MQLLIDTHSHLNLAAFDKDRAAVIKKNLLNNIWVLNIGTNLYTSKKALEIAEQYDRGVYASVGLHPINLDTGLLKMKSDRLEGSHFEKGFDSQAYQDLARSDRVVAIGEIGLDYYWKPKTSRKKELNLPVIFHCRMASFDLIRILSEHPEIRPQKAVVHSFVGTEEDLEQYLNLGFYIGFNGIIFKNIEGIDFEAIIKRTPVDRILLETDCPYLTPPQKAGERNEPIFLKYIAERVAQIRNMDYDQVIRQSTLNAKTLFGI